MAQENTKEFFRLLKEQFGPALALYKEETDQEDRDEIRDFWEENLKRAGLPFLEKSNLIVLSSLLPIVTAMDSLTDEELRSLIVSHFLVLIDDIINPNS